MIFPANLQFRTLPRQGHLGVHRNSNDGGTLVSVIPSPSFMSGSVMGHHTIRRPTQSGLVETVPTSMSGSFYSRNSPLAINTSQHQQFFYGWQQMSPVPAALSPVVTMPQSILKQSVNYQKSMMDIKEDVEKRDTWVSFDV